MPRSRFGSSIVHARHENGFDSSVTDRKGQSQDKNALLVSNPQRVPECRRPVGLPQRTSIIEPLDRSVADPVAVRQLVVDNPASAQGVDFVAIPAAQRRTAAQYEPVEK